MYKNTSGITRNNTSTGNLNTTSPLLNGCLYERCTIIAQTTTATLRQRTRQTGTDASSKKSKMNRRRATTPRDGGVKRQSDMTLAITSRRANTCYLGHIARKYRSCVGILTTISFPSIHHFSVKVRRHSAALTDVSKP